MATNWSQATYDAMTMTEREAELYLSVCPQSPASAPTPKAARPSTDRTQEVTLRGAGYTRRKVWFVGWGATLAALAGGMTFFIFHIASVGVLGSALTVSATAAAIALGHYLLRGRVFARGLERERQQFQDQAARTENGETEPPDEFPLGLNDRERRELLQFLEHPSAATTGFGGSGDAVAIRRTLQEKGARVRA
jgi:hypothetical protein